MERLHPSARLWKRAVFALLRLTDAPQPARHPGPRRGRPEV
ncbi:hypothetical protein [Streptacidiphilus pinicola]|nr:hypothetical protein [Streptacidiphilus pinicola]